MFPSKNTTVSRYRSKKDADNAFISFASSSSKKTSNNMVKLVMPKAVNLPVKILPLTEPRPNTISVPAEANKFQLFSQNYCQINDVFNIPELERDSNKVELLTLPAAKVLRPPVSLLATCNYEKESIRCQPSTSQQKTSSKIMRSIRPKETPRLVNKCRLCGTLGAEMLEIFGCCGNQKRIIEKISALLPFKVELNDLLPSKICVRCNSRLDSAYNFYITCVEVDLALKIQREAEDSENARKCKYVPLILSDNALLGGNNWSESLRVDPSTLTVIDEKLVSVSTSIPKNKRVAQVVEALKAGLGVEVPILEKTNSAGDAFNLLAAPLNPLAPAQFHCYRCNSNLSNSFELLEHDLLKFGCSQCQLRFCTSKLRRQHRFKNHRALPSCTDCSLSFFTRVQLRDHLQLKLFSCACCSFGFHSKTALKMHLLKQIKSLKITSDFEYEKTKTQLFEIRIQKRQDSRALFSNSEHLELHSSSRFQCDHCGAQYLHKLQLARHIKIKHLLQSFRCNVCQEIFNSRLELSTHYLGHDSKILTQLREHSEVDSIFTCPTPFKCNVCGKCEESSSLLRRHLLRHKTDSIEKKESSTSKSLSECNICWKKFVSATNLKIHVAMAHLRNQKPIAKKPKNYLKFKCDSCPKVFKVERDMLDHRSAVHLNTLLYSCNFCGNRFSTNANKKVHVFGKKVLPNYPCAVCLEAFPNKCQRNLHQQFHEQGSAKEFKCNLCEETFCKLAQLHGHLGKKHPHQVSKSIYCDICGKGFNAKSKFNKHYNSHLLIDEVDASGVV